LTSWSWAVAIVLLLLLLPHVVGEDLLREEATTVDINLLLDDILCTLSTVPHV